MFCRNCGKELPTDAVFCPNCGQQERSSDFSTNYSTGVSQTDEDHIGLLDRYDAGWIVKVISIVTLIANIVIRILYNEITTVYYALAQDDYYTISEDGKTLIYLVCALCVALSAGLLLYCKYKRISYYKKPMLALPIALAVSLVAVFLKIPAPY